jgi:hypothetical protein
MSIDTPQRVAFLNRVHLFTGLTEDQMGTVAAELTEQTFPPGKEIIKLGDPGGSLYLIWSGKVTVTRLGTERPSGVLADGDYFGEDSIVVNHHHQSATVIASEETTTLVLTRTQFEKLIKQIGLLGTNIHVTINSHRLEKRVHFKWLEENEVVYFLARKHSILLVQGLTLPVLLALGAIIGMLASWYFSLWQPQLATVWYISLIVGLCAAGWGVWNGIDWGNDYYIVTDRRIVWVEHVVGLYESRQETPLSAVQRVNVELDLTGRLLDYGDLVVQTIVGTTLKFRSVDHPYQAAALIDQHWKRTQDVSRKTSSKMEEGEMKTALRARLVDGQAGLADVDPVVAQTEQKNDPYKDQRGFINLFRLRFEHLTTVTYRKHLFVLFEQTLIPGVILLFLFVILVLGVFSKSASFATLLKVDPLMLALLWAFLYVAAIAWWIYEYIDWSNDIFQVTPDQIMDIDKTPLGQVTSDIASLDNILSIGYQRVGILELLFNYGTVFITIGGGKEMHFENVYNPSAVQQDIERRRLERLARKDQETIKTERERVADWFAAYYNNEQQFRSAETQPVEKKLESLQPQTTLADDTQPADSQSGKPTSEAIPPKEE